MNPQIRKRLLIGALVCLAIGGGIELARMNPEVTEPTPQLTGKLDCKQADSEAFTNQFMTEMAQHENALLSSSDPVVWKRFEEWVHGITCLDGAYAEGVMAVWEAGITQNWPLFLAYYRTPEAEKPRLKLMVEAIYNANENSVIDETAAQALRRVLAKDCPAEFKDVCSKKPVKN